MPELQHGDETIKPGDTIQYNNRRDGKLSEARVTRILRTHNPYIDTESWVVEAVTTDNSLKPGQHVLLTPGRTGNVLQLAEKGEAPPRIFTRKPLTLDEKAKLGKRFDIPPGSFLLPIADLPDTTGASHGQVADAEHALANPTAPRLNTPTVAVGSDGIVTLLDSQAVVEAARRSGMTEIPVVEPSGYRRFSEKRSPPIDYRVTTPHDAYTKGGMSGPVNRYLSRTSKPAERQTARVQEIQDTIKGLDEQFKLAPPLERPTTVWRGEANLPTGLGAGDTFQVPGYSSTTLSEQSSYLKATDKAVLKINLPAGTRALASNAFSEHELTLPRGSRFHVETVGTERVAGVDRQVYTLSLLSEHVVGKESPAVSTLAPSPVEQARKQALRAEKQADSKGDFTEQKYQAGVADGLLQSTHATDIPGAVAEIRRNIATMYEQESQMGDPDIRAAMLRGQIDGLQHGAMLLGRQAPHDRPLTAGLDYYKATMSQVQWRNHRSEQVTFSFHNRDSKRRLLDQFTVEELQTRLDHFKEGWSVDELDEMSKLERADGTGKMFDPQYLAYLHERPLPDITVGEDPGTHDLTVETTGDWPMATFWETVVLSEVNQLYFEKLVQSRHLDMAKLQAEGDRRLTEKIAVLKAHPEIKIAEFGTRRHFSSEWQQHVIERLHREAPGNLIGSSNMRFAHEEGIPPIGSYAHEMDMTYAGLADAKGGDIAGSHAQMMADWQSEYGDNVAIALTDTFGTDFFFQSLTAEQARKWQGLRHDSGDPFEFGERAIAWYESHGIDPKTKTLLFSDALDMPKVLALQERFGGRMKVAFGIGTNLTNDLGIPALNVVMKATAVNGVSTVKLSDAEGKHTGTPEQVAKYQRIFRGASLAGWQRQARRPRAYIVRSSAILLPCLRSRRGR